MSASENWYVCDYDLPMEPRIRMRFYRRLTKLLRDANVELAKRSTQSVWISDDERLARSIHDLALQFGRSHFYRAERLD